jgi:N6-L-threonylcarbamoyladenine synthase
MNILAIETSCDETGVAIVEGSKEGSSFSFRVFGSALLSQAALHAQYGGVYPTLAKREHEKNLPVIYEEAIEKAGDVKIDAIAVTVGPGLEPALWQGVEFAKKIAQEKNLPLIPVNHMEGHLISSLVQGGKLENVKLPIFALLISGGHTEFVLMREWFNYEIIGETLDDAVGEAFDKVARMLGLPYPGGPEISKLAERSRQQPATSLKESELRTASVHSSGAESQQDETYSPSGTSQTAAIRLPRPMLKTNNCDVSFSGLKTAALYALRGKSLTDDEKAAFAKEFEDAVGDVFVAKSRRALQETGAKTFVIGGGVAANKYLRGRLQSLVHDEFPDVEFRLPELSITGDNAIMIAEGALVRELSGIKVAHSAEIRAVGNLSISKGI